MTQQLSHFDEHGASRMVDVSQKPITERTARASATVRMSSATLSMVRNRELAKGDVFEVARLAGIMAAKRTADLIPLCHPLPLDSVSVDFSFTTDSSAESTAVIRIDATASCTARTGTAPERAVDLQHRTVHDGPPRRRQPFPAWSSPRLPTASCPNPRHLNGNGVPMKPRRLIARLAASSIALLALLAYSSPAGASGDYPLWTPTLTSTCANGAITAASASSGSVHLVGWVQPCASAAISDRWGIVGINTGLQDTVLELYPYAGAASVPFSVTAPLTGSLGQFDAVLRRRQPRHQPRLRRRGRGRRRRDRGPDLPQRPGADPAAQPRTDERQLRQLRLELLGPRGRAGHQPAVPHLTPADRGAPGRSAHTDRPAVSTRQPPSSSVHESSMRVAGGAPSPGVCADTVAPTGLIAGSAVDIHPRETT